MIYAIIIQNRDELSVKRSSVHKFSDNLTFKFVRDSGYEDYKLRVYVKKKENEYMLEVKNEDTFVVDSRFLSETGWLSLSFALVKDEEINHLGIAKINVKDSFGNESTVLPEEKVIWQKYVDQEISKVTDPIIKDVNDSKNEVSSNLKKVEDIKASMDELKQNVDTSKNEIDKKYEEIKKIAVDGGSSTNITIDDALSATSKNPVENRIIKNELDKKAAKNEIPTNLSSLNEDETHQTVTADEKKKWDSKSDFDGDFNSLKNIPKIPDAVTVDSSLSSTSTNPVQNKVIKTELDKKAAKNEIPTNLSSLNEDETHQTVTADEKKKWDGKSDFDGDFNSLNNIPNIPDAVIVDAELNETSTNAIQNQAVAKELGKKIPKGGLKTINGESIIGSGDITISGGGGVTPRSLKLIIDFTVEKIATKYIFTKEEYPDIEDLTFIFVRIKYASEPSATPWGKLKINDINVSSIDKVDYTVAWMVDASKGFWDYSWFKSSNPVWFNSDSNTTFGKFTDPLYFVKYEKINKISVESYQNFLDVGANIQIYGC